MPVSLFCFLLRVCRCEVRFLIFYLKIFEAFIVKATACLGVASWCTQPCQKKELLFVRQRRFPKSCRYRECDHVGLLCRDGREAHTLCLSKAVLASQMPVRFHC